MSAAVLHKNISSVPLSMNWGMFASFMFHGMLVGLIIYGLPHVQKPPPILDTAITVDIIEVAEERQTDKPPVEAPPPEEPPKIEEIIAKQKEAPKAPPKVEATEPPKAVPVKAPPPPPKQVVKPKPKIPPPPSEPLEKVEPEPEPEPPEEVAEEAAQPDQFASLLKNLQAAEEQQPDVPDINPQAQNPEPSPLARFAERITMSEADALRRQLSRCWSIQAGARYAENLIVEVKLIVSRERRVMSATIVDQARYGRDTFFRAAGDSALRAVRSPMCDPLDLPPQKYDLWKEMIVSFDPRDML